MSNQLIGYYGSTNTVSQFTATSQSSTQWWLGEQKQSDQTGHELILLIGYYGNTSTVSKRTATSQCTTNWWLGEQKQSERTGTELILVYMKPF